MSLRASTGSRLAQAVAAATVLLAGLALWVTSGSAADKSIRTMGTEDVHINSKIFSDLRFSPGNAVVRSGESITLDHADKTDEPHTLTIVNADELPSDAEGVFGCGEPGTVCDDVFSTVGPQIVDPDQSQFINVSGGAGLDGRFDTIWLPPDTSLTVPVTAPSGMTLAFFCAIHPWMQGEIRVA
jgi:FtsP/CotA-like multicopper oxidase with cupredoxin domain